MWFQDNTVKYIWILFAWLSCEACGQVRKEEVMKYNPLTNDEERVILRKGTEAPFVGEYTENKAKGTYVCRQCNAPLYRSEDKFSTRCGWPSFDDDIADAVIRLPDADVSRTLILCANF